MYDYRTPEYRIYVECHNTTVKVEMAGAPGLDQQRVTEEIALANAQRAAAEA